jgi:hypothetical protein
MVYADPVAIRQKPDGGHAVGVIAIPLGHRQVALKLLEFVVAPIQRRAPSHSPYNDTQAASAWNLWACCLLRRAGYRGLPMVRRII